MLGWKQEGEERGGKYGTRVANVIWDFLWALFLFGEQRATRIRELLEVVYIFPPLCSTFNKTSVLASADEFT